jgi:MFS family permease
VGSPEPTPDRPVPAALPPRNRFGPDLRPLAIPAYRRLFLGGVATAIGSQLSAVAVQQQIFDITGSSAYVGLASLVALVPLIVFGLIGGAIADTHDRRKLLMITSTGIAVTALGLWLQSLCGLHSVVVVMALLAIQQGFFAVNQPTRSAIIPRIVPAELVPSANALGFTVFGFGVLGGPLLAGLLIPLTGLAWLYFAEAVALVAMLYPVFKLPPIPPLGELRERAKVLEGLRFLWFQPLILMTFVVDIIAMVFGMPRALFPEMAESTFGGPVGGGPQLGLLNAGMAIGVLAGGLTSGWLSKINRQGSRSCWRSACGADRWPCWAPAPPSGSPSAPWRSAVGPTWSAPPSGPPSCRPRSRIGCAAGCRGCSPWSSPVVHGSPIWCTDWSPTGHRRGLR